MSERLETIVVVTDRGSQTFVKVGDAATKMGTSIDKAGTTGSKSLGSLSKAGAAAGVAFSALAGTLSLASRANAAAEASQARLETAIENSGHSMFEYEDALNAASEAALQLGFDDEDAADSIAALTTATGDAEKALEDLSIAEDIARARNISLEAATKLVIATEQGRLGALARVGIQLDETSTREERLDALRGKFAGNAEAYSKTSAAGYDRLKNSAENALEAIGAHLGPSQELLMILPGLSTGFTGVGAAVGALAPNLTKAAAASALLNVALGPVGVAALAVAAGLAIFGYSKYLRDNGDAASLSDDANQQLNETLKQQIQIGSVLAPLTKEVADAVHYIEPITQDYIDTLNDLNAQRADDQKQADLYKQSVGEESDLYKQAKANLDETNAAILELVTTRGKQYISQEQLNVLETKANEILSDTGPAARDAQAELRNLTDQVSRGDLVWALYADKVITLADGLDDASLSIIEAGDGVDTVTDATEKGTAAADAYTAAHERLANGLGIVGIGFRNSGEAGAAWNTTLIDGVRAENDAADAARAHDAALKDQLGAYYGLADGIITASDAQSAFKATQDGILASQEPFNHQLSEYNGQLDNLQNAEDLLNQRRAEGIPLTAAQEDFLARVDAAQQRLQGGTEDATLALGEQALQYAENMRIGDELNQNMGDTADATSALDQTIQDLILALQGIPGYVSTYIDVDAENARLQTDHIRQQLDALQGYTSYARVVITGYYTGPNVGFTMNQQHGGVIPHAQHGIMGDGRTVVVGETGPELVKLPGGSLTLPAPASKEMLRGGGGMTFTGPITIVANDPREFENKMRAYTYASQR